MRDKEVETRSRGRPLGAPNKRTTEYLEVLAKNNFCPATTAIEIYGIALAQFADELKKVESGRYSPMESNAHAYLKIAADMTKELAAYAYPRQKAISHTTESPIDGMTPQEKLEAMKQAVKMLEIQVNESRSETT